MSDRLSTNTETITILIDSITYIDLDARRKILLLDGLVIIEFDSFGNKGIY